MIEDDPPEAAALYQDFLIRVTGFFCDPEALEGLQERVFPSVCEGRSAKQPIRIWVPGCASGEEEYSIAIKSLGFLMLGASESVGISSDLIELNDKHRLYIRNPTGVNSGPGFAQRIAPMPTPRHGLANAEEPLFSETESAPHEADRLLLSRFAPASLVINEDLKIVQIRGETGRYLEHASGPSSLNLERGVPTRREGLSVDDLERPC